MDRVQKKRWPVRITAPSLSLLLVMAAGCGGSDPPPPPAPEEAAPERPATDRAPGGDTSDAERAAEAARMAVLTERIHYDYDSSDLREEARQKLDAKIAILRQYPALRLEVQGHADDRGSTEYNLALGSRRASAVVDYMTGFGLDAGRFQTVSFGEERPLVRDASERSWALNRRGEFRVIAGGGSPNQP